MSVFFPSPYIEKSLSGDAGLGPSSQWILVAFAVAAGGGRGKGANRVESKSNRPDEGKTASSSFSAYLPKGSRGSLIYLVKPLDASGGWWGRNDNPKRCQFSQIGYLIIKPEATGPSVHRTTNVERITSGGDRLEDGVYVCNSNMAPRIALVRHGLGGESWMQRLDS